MGVEPAGDVERPDLGRRPVPVPVAEVLEEVLVQGVRGGFVVPLGVVEEEVTEDGDGDQGRGRGVGVVLGQEPAEGAVRLLLVLLALDQLDLLTLVPDPDLGVAPPVERAKERLAGHCSAPCECGPEVIRKDCLGRPSEVALRGLLELLLQVVGLEFPRRRPKSLPPGGFPSVGPAGFEPTTNCTPSKLHTVGYSGKYGSFAYQSFRLHPRLHQLGSCIDDGSVSF